jgi:hypothetical protein
MVKFFKIILILMLVVMTQQVYSQSEKDLVLQTIQTFFDSLADHDVEKAKGVMMAEGQFVSVRDSEDGVKISHNTHKAFFKRLKESKEVFKEVMKNPEVKIHKSVAMVWAPYEFYRDNKFSHNGVDVFSLIKTKEGWKITGTVYTVESR